MLENLNSTSEEDGEDDSKPELKSSSHLYFQHLKNILEQSYPASKEMRKPKNRQIITKHFAKRCTDQITKRNYECPLFKDLRKRAKFNSECNLLCRKKINDRRRSLKNLFKTKFTRNTNDYKRRAGAENIIAHRQPYVNEDKVNSVVGKGIVKGRGEGQFICRCYGDFIDPDVSSSSRKNNRENIYQLGPVFDPVHYIQSIQHQQRLLAKSSLETNRKQVENYESSYPNAPLYSPYYSVTPDSNIVLPIVYLNNPYNSNPVSKDYPYDIVRSAKTKENDKIGINACSRLYGQGFGALSALTQQDSLEEKTDSFEYEEPVLGAEAPEYEDMKDDMEDDCIDEYYDETTEPSLHEPLEPLEHDGDTLGTLHEYNKEENYDETERSVHKSLQHLEPDEHTSETLHEDDNEEYHYVKSEAHDSDEVFQYKPKESIGQAKAISQNSRYRTVQTKHATVSENIVKTPINDGSEEVLGTVNVGQPFPSAINIEPEEKTTDSASKEIVTDIPFTLGKGTKNSLEVTKDETFSTENKQYTFSNEEKSLTEDYIIEEKEKKAATSSEDKKIEFKDDIVAAANVDTLPKKPIAEVMYENLPSVEVTERICESEELGETDYSCSREIKVQNSEEEILSMKPTDKTINSETEPSSDLSLEISSAEVMSSEYDKYQVDSKSKEIIEKTARTSSKVENSKEEIFAMEPPDKAISSEIETLGEVSAKARKYETGAAKSVKTSSKSRSMSTKTSSESSIEVESPEVISSESNQYQLDSNSEEMSAETPIKYYSPKDRLLEYKKNHQNEYYSSIEQSENTASYDSVQEESFEYVDSDIPESQPTSETPWITEPTEFQTDEENEKIVGVTEGSGMLEEENLWEPLETLKHFDDFEASGHVNEDEYVASPILSSESPYVTEVTVAKNENIDDQYTGAAFTEDTEKSIQEDNANYEITESQQAINRKSLTESSLNKSDYEVNLYTVTERTSDVRTIERNNNEDIPLVITKPDVKTSGPNNNDNNQLFGSSQNWYSMTVRTADKATGQNSNNVQNVKGSSSNKMYETDSNIVTPKTSDDITTVVKTATAVIPVNDKIPDDEKNGKIINEDNQSIELSAEKIREKAPVTYEHDYAAHPNPMDKTSSSEMASLTENIYYVPTPSELEDSHEDSLYLGKILPQNGNNPRSLEKSDLLYIGDGVRLPLKTIKMDDGSYSLAFSNRRCCDSSVKKNCPCYYQPNQHKENNSANDKKRSMKDDDDEERDFEEYYLTEGSKKAVRDKKNVLIDDSTRGISKNSAEQSRYRRRDEKKEDLYNNFVETVLDVNDIPERDRAGVIVNALDRVVNDAGVFNTKNKFKEKKYEISRRDSTVGKLQSEENEENHDNVEPVVYDTSKRVEVLKAILSWVKDFILTAANGISRRSL